MEVLKIPMKLFKENNIKGDTKILLCVININKGEDNIFYKSNSFLCDYMKWSLSKVKRELKILNDLKYIKSQVIRNKDNQVIIRKITLLPEYFNEVCHED